MTKKFRNVNETNPERIPTAEEVSAVFRELAGKEYEECKELRKLEDEKGLYVLEVEVPGESERERTKYEYMRKGHYQQDGIITTEIHVTYFEDGIPVSGTTAAKYVEGQWIIIK